MMAGALNAEEFRALARNLGEPYRWFKAFRANNYDPSDNTYQRNAVPDARKGRIYVEQTLPTGARCLISRTRVEMEDEKFGLIPIGETVISVLPDESFLARFDEIILPVRKQVSRAVMTRAHSGDVDSLPESNPVSITDARQNDTEYANGEDYELQGSSIRWLTMNRPEPDSKYSIEFEYNPVYTFLGEGAGERMARPDVNGVLMPMRGVITLKAMER